jgi:L-fuconolactonase
MTRVVDAHHHVWTADYAWLADPALARIRRDYTMEDLRGHLTAAGVDRTVLVEAGSCEAAETRRFLALAERTPEIAGVVGWASLTDPILAATLAGHRAAPGGRFLVGVRDQAQAYAEDWLDLPSVAAGLRAVAGAGLVNELVVRPVQLPSVVRVLDALPGGRFVLDHLGKPSVRSGRSGLESWRALIAPVAARPNVVAKVSGLVAEADWDTWTVKDLRPFVEAAVDLFGTDRLMFGSDWPVCEVAASYEQVKQSIVDILGGVPEDVFAGTAQRTYELEIR